jgi:hypothetical protein
VQYEPAFLKEVESNNSECYYSQEVIARKEKEKQDKEQLVAILEKNNISQVVIDRIKTYCF